MPFLPVRPERSAIRVAALPLLVILLTACALQGQQPRPAIRIPESAQVVIGKTTKMPTVRASVEGLPGTAKVSLTFDILAGPPASSFASGKSEEQAAGAPGAEVAVPRLANVPGKYEIRVRAVVPGFTEVATATFELVSTVGPKRLQVEPAVPGAAELSVCKPSPAPEVRVVDENGQPVYGAEVNFRLPASPQGGTFTGGLNTVRAITDENGRAAAAMFHADKKGPLTISVSAVLTPDVTGQAGIQQIIQGCGSSKKYLILAIAGGGAVGGMCAGKVGICKSGGGGGGGGGGDGATAMTPGTTRIGAP